MHNRLFVAAALLLTLNLLLSAQEPDGFAAADRPPAAVLAIVRQAQIRAAAGDWDEAARLGTEAVGRNPTQPAWWYALGIARCRAKDFAGAIAALERAAELGAPMMGAYYSIYEIARCHALAGDAGRAVDALQRALRLGYPDLEQAARDPDLASIRHDPRVVEMLGLQDVSRMSREDGWRYDLSILAREVHRKGFNTQLYVQRPVTRDDFDARVRQLHDAIPTVTDGQLILAFMRLMALIGDGHSAVWDVGEHALLQLAMPLRLFLFEEGLFVTAAHPAHRTLVGAQIEKIDGRSATDIVEAMAPYIPRDRGNPMVTKTRAPYVMRKTALLHAAGLIDRPDRVTLTVRDLAGVASEVVIASAAEDADIWNVLPAPASWVTFASTLPSPPHYLRRMHSFQWFEFLPDQKTVYFQFNRVRDDPAEPLARFADRLMSFIEGNDVERLVIDMRWNNGGNTASGQALLLGLLANRKVNQRGRLFVIIGRRTYSAAQNMATYFGRHTNAIFVGEPTGSSPNFIGEEVPLTLPYSRLKANVSHLLWQSSWPQDQRMWIAPEIYIPPTFADFRSGHDAALAAILQLPAPPR